jgi:nicotinamidase-related amidase
MPGNIRAPGKVKEQALDNTAAVIVIDLQSGMFDGSQLPPIRNADTLIQRSRSVIEWARRSGRPVAFIRHDAAAGEALEPNTSGWHILPALARAEDEPIFSKRVANAFSQPALVDWLARLGVTKVILVGAQTDECVTATVNGARSRGLAVTVVGDAHSTWDIGDETADQIIARHNIGFSAAGAEVTSTEALIRS